MIQHRGRQITAIRLRNTFSIAGDDPMIEQTVVARADDQFIGITVDEVLGQSQTVIKSLGQIYRKTPGFMGATIMGDGSVAMILDVPQLSDDARAVQAPGFTKGNYHA